MKKVLFGLSSGFVELKKYIFTKCNFHTKIWWKQK